MKFNEVVKLFEAAGKVSYRQIVAALPNFTLPQLTKLKAMVDQSLTKPSAAPAHTGGKVPGQLSQTPNAIRKRNARAAATAAKTASPATPNYGATSPGYGKTTMNAPAGVSGQMNPDLSRITKLAGVQKPVTTAAPAQPAAPATPAQVRQTKQAAATQAARAAMNARAKA